MNHLMQSIGVLLISFLTSAMCLAEHPASLVGNVLSKSQVPPPT